MKEEFSALKFDPRERIEYRHDLIRNNNNPRCIVCGNIFRVTKPYQQTCSKACYDKDQILKTEIQEKKFTGLCKVCGQSFRKTQIHNREQTCEICKQNQKIERNKTKIDPEKWVNAKKRKGISLEELNRRAEWKRVFDDREWDHYLRGRKWDKI